MSVGVAVAVSESDVSNVDRCLCCQHYLKLPRVTRNEANATGPHQREKITSLFMSFAIRWSHKKRAAAERKRAFESVGAHVAHRLFTFVIQKISQQ